MVEEKQEGAYFAPPGKIGLIKLYNLLPLDSMAVWDIC